MFDGLKRKVAATAVSGLLKSLATSKDTQTTIAGLIAGAVLAIPGLDLAAVIAGDPHHIARLLSGLAVAAIGWLATKEGCDHHTTAIGAAAGAVFAAQGSLDKLITGVVVALLGYLTNKPTAKQEPAK
ncbi:MAG: hypothetical protein LAQ30_01585 [Acidobacteriia bacterium]|nr:hypothetical protein [Terriglobia bacterium]